MNGNTTTHRPWTRSELLVAMHLYFQLPFGKFHRGNQEIIQVSQLIGRSPSSLAMKLCNIASLDPIHQQRGVAGLRAASNQDREIWQEFTMNWTVMAETSAREMAKMLRCEYDSVPEIPESVVPQATTRMASILVRKGQGFFRSAVLMAYGNTCCMTGCQVPSLLVASHIVPWSADESNRLNPRNGLCLAPLQDKAFDQGLIALSDDYRILASHRLLELKGDPLIKSELLPLIGTNIALPNRLAPEPQMLRKHRETVFSKNN